MPLSSGTRLGPYEIVTLLGQGGMGTVYRARDPRLGRDVAIKVLPEAIATDPDRLRRFEQEARAIAALNHPNILTVHDVGTDDGAPYVVTELLDGETWREVLGRRAPTPHQVLTLAVQAAQGLAAAHARGIVHRDLKPENLFLTTDGRVKILDFGLAKQASTAGTGVDVTTTDASPTQPGMLVGTLAYMAPEQIEGRPVDARSDVFAFGVVLYELLTRQHPFRRETVAATVAAILQETPPAAWSGDGGLPPELVPIVRRCLAKRREERFADGGEIARALGDVLHAPAGASPLEAVSERSPYPGLRSFTEADAALFFGREDEVVALWARIRARRLLAVIGPSGAGKTSFVRAGVLPARRDGWAAIVCTPGTAPLRGLGQALGPELTGDRDALRQLVSFDDPDVAFALLRRWRQAHTEALVVIDQFEELFTLNAPEVQASFSALLGRLAIEGDLHIVLSLRDDFLMRCHDRSALAPVFSEITPLGPLTPTNLRRALVEPAIMRGYRFEDEALVDEMVSSVEGTRGALPLLAFAVSRLWEHRDRERQVLTRAAHERIGGVAGALAQHAEATLDRIGSIQQDVVREIFRNLVTAQGTRAVIDRDELLSVFPDRSAAEAVLRELIEARLLTSYEVEGKAEEPSRHRVEIVHESLLKAWPRLVRWQTQDEDGAQLRDQLKQTAHLWEQKGRTSDLLWTGTALQEFALWRQRYPGALTALEEDYARAMRARALRRKRLRRAAVAVVMVGLGAVAVAIGISRQASLESARRARASKLVALGRLELERYPTAAVAYAGKSLAVADTAEARLLALEALWRGPVARILELPRGSACSRVAFSPDGRALACAGFSDSVLLFDDNGNPPRTYASLPVVADIRQVAFAYDGRLLTWAPSDPSLRMLPRGAAQWTPLDASVEWLRVLNERHVATLGPASVEGQERVLLKWATDDRRGAEVAHWTPPPGIRFDQPGMRPVSIDPQLRWLAFADGSTVYLRSLGGGRTEDYRLGAHASRLREVEFGPGGETLVSVDETGGFRIWSVAARQMLRQLQTVTPHRYSRPVFNSDGSLVSWMSGVGSTYIWDLRAPADVAPLVLRWADVRDSGDGSFDPQGRWLASAGWSNVALWPLAGPRVQSLVGHTEGPILDLTFSPDSKALVSCARDGTRIRALDPGAGPGHRVDLGRDYYCYGVTFSPDGRTLAINSPFLGTHLLPTNGGPPRLLIDLRGKRAAAMPAAFDASARTLAVAPMYSASDADMILRLVDLGTGGVRAVPLREAGSGDAYSSSAHFLKFLHDGRLLIAGSNGIRRWDPDTRRLERLVWGTRFAAIDTDRTGRTIVALTGRLSPNRLRLTDPELTVIDADGHTLHVIPGHGRDLTPTLAVDPGGRFVVTGDAQGIVRVGPLEGGDPHVMPGHSGPVNRVAVSPDGNWIASASGTEIRLWPMPDLSKPPFHTLPYDELMARLGALTNLRVVEDPASPTGYKLEIGPFPGWRDVPSW